MLERVVDDWLSSTTEREFQVPFAQLLAFEGYGVVHIASPHGPMEQGKDILAVSPDGTPCAFQLKAGNLTLSDWRNPEQPLKGQVEDLLDLAIDHPSLPKPRKHRSYLVVTGVLDETLRQHIGAFNEERKRRKKPRIETWVKGDLQRKISGALDRFLSARVQDIRQYLRLLLEDGRGIPKREALAKFLDEVVADVDGSTGERRLRQACTELVLLTSYVADVYHQQENHVSEIEVWTVATSAILSVAAISAQAHRVALPSLGFLERKIWEVMQNLVAELRTREMFVEGDPFADAYVYRHRITHVAGYLGAAFHWSQWLGEDIGAEDVARRFFDVNRPQLLLWGEGAVPSFLSAGWTLDQLNGRSGTDDLCVAMLHAICQMNGPEGAKRGHPEEGNGGVSLFHGLPNPYVSLEDVLQKALEPTLSPMEPDYFGHSYCLEAIIHVLTRRLMRQHLALLWEPITRLAFATYLPTRRRDLWHWHNRSGMIQHRYVEQPTSWSALRQNVQKVDTKLLPLHAEKYPHFLLLHMLVAPHRLNPSVAVLLDSMDWGKGKPLLEAVG